MEIYFYTVNVSGLPIMNIRMDAQSAIWGWESPSIYYLTSDYDEAEYNPQQNNTPPGQAEGLDFITAPNGWDIFAYGLYKISSNRTNKYFYLDYRDDRIGFYSFFQPPTYGHDIDLWIKYVYPADKFFYSSFSATTNLVEIQNAQVLNFWEIKQKGNPSTDQFPNFWQNCLTVVNDGNNHPKLIWGPYPTEGITFEVTGYNIYRAIHTFRDPTNAQFHKIASVSANQYYYLDQESNIGHGWYGFYKVTAVDETIESEFSNIAKTGIDAFSKDGNLASRSEATQSFSLSHNYPNPFNPTTTKNYKLVESGNVRLVVTNSLGEEVKVIDSGLKEAGEYSAVFNSENLPSGIYICSLITNRGITSNKMLLLR